MKQLNSIQYLRAIAALLVLYAHAIDLQSFLGTSAQQHFFNLENSGAIGVDIFFIISGFIITYISHGKSGFSDAVVFMKRRIIRLVPVYYLISLILLALIFIAGTLPVTKENIIKTFTILPLFDRGTEFWSPVLFLGWTLAFEFFFYLLFSVMIGFRMAHKEIKIIIVMALLVTAGQLFSINNIQWKFITNPIILEFCFGVLIALLYRSTIKVSPAISKACIVAGIILMILLVLKGGGSFSEMADTLDGSSSLTRIILWGIPSAFLVFGFVFFEKESATPSFKNKWILLLGDASYAIYLVHIIAYRTIFFLLKRIPDTVSIIPGDIQIAIYLMIAVTVSVIFYLLVEKKLLKLLKRKSR